MELMNTENIAEVQKLIEDNAHSDEFIEKLILNGELIYVVLEKIIDGTLDKKFIKTMVSVKENSSDLENFQTLLEIGVIDGDLALSDIEPLISRENNRRD